MRTILAVSVLLVVCALPMIASGEQEMSPVAKVLDQELTMLQNDFIPLAEAMPAEKWDFAPTAGEFTGVRNFAQQVSHVAAAIYNSSATILEEKLSPEIVGTEAGPPRLKTKDELVDYLRDAVTYAHKAMAKLTEKNLTDEVQAIWGKAPRLFMADLMLWHSYDHYGQLVEYLRMNGIIPPSSRPVK